MEHGADPDWVLLELEPAKAARAGLPDRIVAPRAEAEAGIDVERAIAARWGAAFAAARPEHRLAPGLAALAAAEPYRLLAERLVAAGRPADAAVALARAIELDALRRRLARQPRERAAARGRLRGARSPSSTRPSGRTATTPRSTARAAACSRASTSPTARSSRTSARSSSRPGDGFLLDRLEALGALKKLTAPDGHAYWLTPADFDRVVRAELAALCTSRARASSSPAASRSRPTGTSSSRGVAGLLALRLDPDDEDRAGSAPARRGGRDEAGRRAR